jgi:adenylate cyclase
MSTTGEGFVGAILFTDLVGFTEYTDAAGDAAALDVLDQQTKMMTTALHGRPNARIIKELGDGLLVWFDTPCDGVETAIAILAAVREARLDDRFPVAIRMGLHHGEMLPRGDDVVGLTVNIASRIAALAGPDELLISQAAADECDLPPDVMLEPVGPVPVKGVQTPVWLARVSTAA